MIYLDNNATTIMPKVVRETYLAWCNQGNPSADYRTAKAAREMMDKVRKYIAQVSRFELVTDPLDKPAGGRRNGFRVIFTSCASEANSAIIRCVVESMNFVARKRAHIVVTEYEHKSLLEAAKYYESVGALDLTIVKPAQSGPQWGRITPDSIAAAIRPGTSLVCVMQANNETGVVNDVAAIGALCHQHNVPFYTDAVQCYGRFPLRDLTHIDAFAISFHKMHGPPGTGALVIRDAFVRGYQLSPLIHGSQNYGLRGGTENIPGIAASFTGMQLTLTGRAQKNARLATLREAMARAINATMTYPEYVVRGHQLQTRTIIRLSGTQGYLPSTLLVSVVDRRVKICNVKIKQALEAIGIVISIGSACNTHSDKASHVLYALGADEYVRRGALRISLSDDTTPAEVQRFATEFNRVVSQHSA